MVYMGRKPSLTKGAILGGLAGGTIGAGLLAHQIMDRASQIQADPVAGQILQGQFLKATPQEQDELVRQAKWRIAHAIASHTLKAAAVGAVVGTGLQGLRRLNYEAPHVVALPTKTRSIRSKK